MGLLGERGGVGGVGRHPVGARTTARRQSRSRLRRPAADTPLDTAARVSECPGTLPDVPGTVPYLPPPASGGIRMLLLPLPTRDAEATLATFFGVLPPRRGLPRALPPGSTTGSPRSMVFRPSRDSRGVSVWPPCRAAFGSRRNGASRGRPRKTLVVHAPRCALPEEPDPVAFDPCQVFDRAPEGSVRSLWCVRRPAPPPGPWEEAREVPLFRRRPRRKARSASRVVPSSPPRPPLSRRSRLRVEDSGRHGGRFPSSARREIDASSGARKGLGR